MGYCGPFLYLRYGIDLPFCRKPSYLLRILFILSKAICNNRLNSFCSLSDIPDNIIFSVSTAVFCNSSSSLRPSDVTVMRLNRLSLGAVEHFIRFFCSSLLKIPATVGGIIYDSFGGNGCFIAATIFSLLIVVFIALADTRKIDPWYKHVKTDGTVPKETTNSGFRLDKIFEKKSIPISLCIFCLCFGYAALMSFYRLYAKYANLTNEFRYFFLIYAAMLIVSRPAAGKIQDKLGDNAICYPCIIAQTVGILLIAWKPCMITIVICALCGALGYGTLNSTLNVIVNRQVSDDRRPFAVSTFWAFSDFGVGIAPAILGAIATVSNYYVLYYVAALISLIALPIYWGVWGRQKARFNRSHFYS
jgi:hypothetical protein